MEFKILYIKENEVHIWTLEDILDHINDGRSDAWTNYDATDWNVGWNEWVVPEGNYKILKDEN